MSYNTIFKDLTTVYSTWNELRQYLESDAGGRFRVVDKKDDLCLIRYQKGHSRMDLPHSKWFRSVVWNTATNQPISIAPPKVSMYNMPFNTFQEIRDNSIVCQEQMDGFMINCFRKVGDETLYITSRSKLDAAGHFYSSKSFRTLFIETYMKTSAESTENLEELIQVHGKDMEYPDVSKKEVSVYYSFLVQHIAHRIVTPVSANKLFLIHKGIVYEDGTMSINDNNPVCKGQELIPCIPLEISNESLNESQNESQNDLPEQFFHDSEVVQWIKTLFKTKTWTFQGIVFKDTEGNRWRFRNEKYSLVKSLRGNSASTIDRFAQLYTENLTYTYLQYYPDDNFFFSCHTIFINMIIDYIYNNYIGLFITKTINKHSIDSMYIPHLFALHGIYLKNLRPNGTKITPQQIIMYFHKQPWQRIAYLIKKFQDTYFVQLGEIINSV